MLSCSGILVPEFEDVALGPMTIAVVVVAFIPVGSGMRTSREVTPLSLTVWLTKTADLREVEMGVSWAEIVLLTSWIAKVLRGTEEVVRNSCMDDVVGVTVKISV